MKKPFWSLPRGPSLVISRSSTRSIIRDGKILIIHDGKAMERSEEDLFGKMMKWASSSLTANFPILLECVPQWTLEKFHNIVTELWITSGSSFRFKRQQHLPGIYIGEEEEYIMHYSCFQASEKKYRRGPRTLKNWCATKIAAATSLCISEEFVQITTNSALS